MINGLKKFFGNYSKNFWIVILAMLVTIMGAAVILRNRADFSREALVAGFVAALLAASCLWLVETNKERGKTNFELLCSYFMRSYKNTLTTMSENSSKAVIALLWGGILAMSSFLLYASLSIDNLLFQLLLLVTFVFVLTLAKFSVKTSITDKKQTFIVVAGIILPVVFHIYLGGYSSQMSTLSIIWMFLALLQSLFSFNEEKSKRTFGIFLVVIVADLLLEILLFEDINYAKAFFSAATMIAIGFGLYTATKVYILYSNENYRRTVDMLTELKNAQSALVKKEKEVVLGRLISGVAHEINTPIGAIKASSETMSVSFENSIRAVMEGSGGFTDDDYRVFFMLVRKTMESLREMKSTVTLRKAKNEVRKFFEEIELPDGNDIIDKLSRLEICDIEMVKENLEVFQSPRINGILTMVCNLSNLIVGMETITIATSKVSKIVFALKSYSHTNVSEEHIQLDIIKTIETVLILYHNQIKSSVEVIRDYGENIPLIDGNSDELSQVWTNLIQNALYAMKNSGTLTVRVCMDGAEGEQDSRVLVSISDTGGGIKPEIINNIFDPFFTTKPLGEGSGLGLDICKKIIMNHKGELTVESKEGIGSVFTVVLPLHINN